MASPHSKSSSFPGTLLVVAAAVVAAGVTAVTIRRRWRHSNSKSKGTEPSSLQFEDGTREAQVQERFEACVKIMGPQIPRLPQRDQLEYYGVFKQATLGDYDEYHSRPPPAFDVVAVAKYNAWKRLHGMERVAAMQDYIDKVVQFEYVKSISGDGSDDDYELEGDAVVDVVGMGNKPSRPAEEQGGGEEDAKYPLHAAAREGLLTKLEMLLSDAAEKGETADDNISPNSKDQSGQTPLHLAADRGHVSCAKSLILNRADIHAADNDGISVLQAAVIGGNAECCRLLLALGADPDQKDHDGDTPRKSAQDDPALKALFEQQQASTIALNDPGFLQELRRKGLPFPSPLASSSAPQPVVDVKKEMQLLDQPIALDLDDDGDI